MHIRTLTKFMQVIRETFWGLAIIHWANCIKRFFSETDRIENMENTMAQFTVDWPGVLDSQSFREI
jgi:hypothetical protein